MKNGAARGKVKHGWGKRSGEMQEALQEATEFFKLKNMSLKSCGWK